MLTETQLQEVRRSNIKTRCGYSGTARILVVETSGSKPPTVIRANGIPRIEVGQNWKPAP